MCVDTYLIVKSKTRRIVRIADEPIELDVLILLNGFWVKQPQRLDVVGLLSVQIDWTANKIAVLLNDSFKKHEF